MSDRVRLPAKATSAENQSDAIVVSFASEWYTLLLNKKFRAVIRKRIPKTMKAKWLYFHVNAPISAICARAEIRSVRECTCSQAKALARHIALSPLEIAAYVGSDAKVGCYHLRLIDLLKRPLSITDIEKELVYHPPQSFLILSREAKAVVDRLAGFRPKPRNR